MRIDLNRYIAAPSHFQGVPRRPKPHVICSTGVGPQGLCCIRVQCCHRRVDSFPSSSLSSSALRAVFRMPVPRGFVSTSKSPAWRRSWLPPIRVDSAHDRQSVFRLVILYGMSSQKHGSGFLDLVCAAPQDFSQYFGSRQLGKQTIFKARTGLPPMA